MADVLAEGRGLAPQASGPRGRGLHRRGGAAAAAGGVAPRQERARLLHGGPHCECEGEAPRRAARREWGGEIRIGFWPGAGGWGVSGAARKRSREPRGGGA